MRKLLTLSTSPSATLLSETYDYTTGVPGNNGQIQRITDNVDATRSTTFTYDPWSRLKTASNAQWSISETYDRFGNRNAQSPPVNFSQVVNPSTNRLLSPYAYDAAGNMTNDGNNTLVYDAENRVLSAANGGASGTYNFDGNSLRVKKASGSSTTVYIFSGSKVIAEYDNGAAVGSPSREYIYSGSQLLATLSGGATTYHHPDHLSVRVTTDSSGNTVRTFGHFPFGEIWYETGVASKWKFTSYERDSESGNDYAVARSYVNRLARFSSPDSVAGSPGNPQSLNRYAYVLNNPLNLVDPLGSDPCNGGECLMMDVENWGPQMLGGQQPWDEVLAWYLAAVEDAFAQARSGGNSSGANFVNQKVLAKCIQDLFGVTLIEFVQSSLGTNGSFRGRGPDSFSNGGNDANISVINDVKTYSYQELTAQYLSNPRNRPLQPGEVILGATDNNSPYVNFTANNLSARSALLPSPAFEAVKIQVHELGNSLHRITGAAFNPATIPGPGHKDAGKALQNCVQKRGGFNKP